MKSRVAERMILGAMVVWLCACNELSGANQWEETERCTGPMCGVCPAGQRWFDGSSSCVPLCIEGSVCGAGCCGFGLRCVNDTSGNQWCSVCESAELICGSATGPLGREECCEPGSTCTNPDRGVCSSAYGVAGQSCSAGLTCNGGSCCASIEVPGGVFLMGSPESDSLAFQDEFPEHEVTVSTYELDKYEVTVGRFRAFVEGWDYRPPPPGAGAHPRIAGSGWRSAWDKRLPQSRVVLENGLNCPVATWPMGTDVLPMNCVTWYEAFTFCVWDGGRLPTEAEWEYAAAGGDENRKYPWGQDTPDPDVHAVHDCAYGGTPRNCDKFDVRAPVGSKPLGAGRWGHDDLAGSMFEWVLDAYDTYDTAIVCNDCANASDVLIRLLRGGSWSTLDQYVRATYRYYSAPTYRYSGVGFRCARNP